VTAGDSAGGALATGLVLQARDAGTPLPAGIAAISPWYDLEANGETFESSAGLDALVGRERRRDHSRGPRDAARVHLHGRTRPRSHDAIKAIGKWARGKLGLD
jgi:acetyl esterase/lipase